MEYIIFTLLGIFVLALIFSKEILLVAAHGWYIKDKEWLSKLVKEKNKNLPSYTYVEGQAISIGSFIIMRTTPSMFSRYNIMDFGRVWKWSKTHKLIEKTFKEMTPTPMEKL